MQPKQRIVSILVTAALSLPCIVYASAIAGVPGSTDEARAAAARQTQQLQSYVSPGASVVSRASSTDEARALAGQRHTEATQVALRPDCMQADSMGRPATTDEVRAALGRRIVAVEVCSPHA